MLPSSRQPRMKWYFTRMCLFRSWKTGFLARTKAELLSTLSSTALVLCQGDHQGCDWIPEYPWARLRGHERSRRRVGGGSGTEVGTLGEKELTTLPARSRWTYSTVKSSYVEVEPASTALSHAHPRPSLNTITCVVHRRCVSRSKMR